MSDETNTDPDDRPQLEFVRGRRIHEDDLMNAVRDLIETKGQRPSADHAGGIDAEDPTLADALDGLIAATNYAEAAGLENAADRAGKLYQQLGTQAPEEDWVTLGGDDPTTDRPNELDRIPEGEALEVLRWTTCYPQERRIILRRLHPAHDEVRVQTRTGEGWEDGKILDEICEGFDLSPGWVYDG